MRLNYLYFSIILEYPLSSCFSLGIFFSPFLFFFFFLVAVILSLAGSQALFRRHGLFPPSPRQ
jgi:hypothetical protein